ncbi:uncharacterized protein CIMG_00389 [Coccidioides immitis RS]|uniref:Ras-GEF domain-containing protein n=3 Tax=Coccidioides immitis TaxID=5501 RepID=A0A0E1RZ94_COCIM|nr:uncharacterized protein CIMG_00389 [Coccidioides immitis RS]EAS35035.2 hypothetical protein CIMG_00389 [Coccidioides immitis RS]KMP00248.1 hypothetical protein CIRG_00390 [Coccidioides immitis RMSCC 2394]KMU84435.1 hypothetical protein CIHG_02220 [Coccidioides immitis H538.4]
MAHHRTEEDFAPDLQNPPLDFNHSSIQDQDFLVSATSQQSSTVPRVLHEAVYTPVASPQPLKLVALFNTELTPPRFHVTYRWWEEEALPILWAFNIGDIKRLLQFRLYDDDDFPRRILQNRNTATLTEFVASLFPPGQPGLLDLAHHEKVDEIIRLCQKIIFPIPWNWFPNYLNGVNPVTIALEINTESVLQFKAISFEDWVRFALGYPTMSIVWFVEQHRELYNLLSAHLDRHPEKECIYVDVEKQLRSRCPWAHRTVLQCLKDRGLASENTIPNHRVAKFLIEPIQALFKSRPRPFVKFLKKLSVLSIRFSRKYHEDVDINWATPFDAEIPHLDDFLASSPAPTLARRLTFSDERGFTGLSTLSFGEENGQLQTLVDNWHLLSMSVEECCTAFVEMLHYFKECVKALLNMRNYYSATAMLHGLQEAQPRPFDSPLIDSLDSLFNLLDSTDNYAAYRRTMGEKPGLPFLHPHIAEYHTKGQGAIAGLFPLSL